MENTTQEEIKWDAIINFLITMDDKLPRAAHIMNAYYDARIYRWNPETTQALINAINRRGD